MAQLKSTTQDFNGSTSLDSHGAADDPALMDWPEASQQFQRSGWSLKARFCKSTHFFGDKFPSYYSRSKRQEAKYLNECT